MEDTFLTAVKAGEVDAVRDMLAADRSLASTRDEQGLSAVLLACYHGRADVRDALLEADPPLDALELAAVGDARALRGADLAVRSPDGFTPLHYAAFFGGPAAVRVLLERGADPDADAENPLRVRPVHSAAARGDRESVQALLDAGAQVDPRQNGGYTPLHAAAHSDDAELAELLLGRGADPDARTEDGRDARALAGPRVAQLFVRAR